MINEDFLFSDHPVIMVPQDNNIHCRTQDSDTHENKRKNYGRSIIWRGCHKHFELKGSKST